MRIIAPLMILGSLLAPPATVPVAVIAPSLSTRTEARAVLLKNPAMREAPIKQADAVLVVVRSGLRNPLAASYDTYCELKENAERQLNIAGQDFHIYLYALNDDLSVSRLRHESRPAE
jgi:hypothetical protein